MASDRKEGVTVLILLLLPNPRDAAGDRTDRRLRSRTSCSSSGNCRSERRDKAEFEVGGWDVRIEVQPSGYGRWAGAAAWVEIKPALGDDYPAVLRQMKANARGHRNGYLVLVFDQSTAAVG